MFNRSIKIICKKTVKNELNFANFLEGKVYDTISTSLGWLNAVNENGSGHTLGMRSKWFDEHFKVLYFGDIKKSKIIVRSKTREILDFIITTMKMIDCDVQEEVNKGYKFCKFVISITISKDHKKEVLQLFFNKDNKVKDITISMMNRRYERYICKDLKEVYEYLVGNF